METIRVSIYLDDYVLDTLQSFGELGEVTDKILADCMSDIDITSLPSAPPPGKYTKRVELFVSNKDYIELSNMYGRMSKKISLRRVLYWFVDNQMYTVYEGYELKNDSIRQKRYLAKLTDFKKFIDKLRRYFCSDECCDSLEADINIALEEVSGGKHLQ